MKVGIPIPTPGQAHAGPDLESLGRGALALTQPVLYLRVDTKSPFLLPIPHNPASHSQPGKIPNPRGWSEDRKEAGQRPAHYIWAKHPSQPLLLDSQLLPSMSQRGGGTEQWILSPHMWRWRSFLFIALWFPLLQIHCNGCHSWDPPNLHHLCHQVLAWIWIWWAGLWLGIPWLKRQHCSGQSSLHCSG